MGYAATVGSFKRALAENVSLLELTYAESSSLTYETVYQKTLDFTNGIYLVVGFDFGNTIGADSYLEFVMEGSQIYENVWRGGAGHAYVYAKRLLSAPQKTYGAFQVNMKTVNAVQPAQLWDLAIYLSEA